MNPEIKARRLEHKAKLLEQQLESLVVSPLRAEGRGLSVYGRRLWHAALLDLGIPRRKISVLTGWTTGQISYDARWVRTNHDARQSVKTLLQELPEIKREEEGQVDANCEDCSEETPRDREDVGSQSGSGESRKIPGDDYSD